MVTENMLVRSGAENSGMKKKTMNVKENPDTFQTILRKQRYTV